ncbi:unnamed protein product [Lota lota]
MLTFLLSGERKPGWIPLIGEYQYKGWVTDWARALVLLEFLPPRSTSGAASAHSLPGPVSLDDGQDMKRRGEEIRLTPEVMVRRGRDEARLGVMAYSGREGALTGVRKHGIPIHAQGRFISTLAGVPLDRSPTSSTCCHCDGGGSRWEETEEVDASAGERLCPSVRDPPSQCPTLPAPPRPIPMSVYVKGPCLWAVNFDPRTPCL